MTLEEGGVVTTCELATWEPEVVDDIPIARDSIVVKIIMKVKSAWPDGFFKCGGTDGDGSRLAGSTMQFKNSAILYPQNSLYLHRHRHRSSVFRLLEHWDPQWWNFRMKRAC